MDTNLETLSFPVTISDGPHGKGETSITVRCHDRLFESVTVLDEAGQKLFTVESPGMRSWSWRRTVKDASGSPIFDLRHFGYGMKNKWAVETPSGREICSLKHVTHMNKERSALDMVVRNEADKGTEVMVEVRPKDRSALTTLVNIEGSHVAEIQNLESNDVANLQGLDRSVWKGRVAGGVDLTLVSTNALLYKQNANFTVEILVIILCRAEMQHVWRQ
jgi:hypothetical protein